MVEVVKPVQNRLLKSRRQGCLCAVLLSPAPLRCRPAVSRSVLVGIGRCSPATCSPHCGAPRGGPFWGAGGRRDRAIPSKTCPARPWFYPIPGPVPMGLLARGELLIGGCFRRVDGSCASSLCLDKHLRMRGGGGRSLAVTGNGPWEEQPVGHLRARQHTKKQRKTHRLGGTAPYQYGSLD